MNQTTVNYLINDDTIKLADGREIALADNIQQSVEFDNAIVVLIDWMATNRNVFGISQEGNRLWQIEEQPAINNGNPCTRLERQGEYLLVGTWDGLELLIEPLTGKVIKERRERGITTEWVDPS